MKIDFKRGAFNSEEAKIDFRKKADFTAGLQECNQLVSELDRVDKFSGLLIDSRAYFRGEHGTYGIPYNEDLHGRKDNDKDNDKDPSPIFPHQESSASSFLSKLRGFGLIADIVGSGKTFEAGVVLSELAIRGLATSVLFIVPEQLIGHWQKTIGESFGLGDIKEVTEFDNKDFTQSTDEKPYREPKHPIIISMENFSGLADRILNNKLFSVIIVDEAHNLCYYSRAMKLLSRLMQTKIKYDRSYCLLLSATPHNGNLKDMFPLWYFIRHKGGKPDDFSNGGNRTREYVEEENFYLNTVCRGATTVSEYVRNAKIALVYEENGGVDRNEKLSGIRKEFDEFLDKEMTGKGKSKSNFNSYSNVTKVDYIDRFLNSKENSDKKETIVSMIADDYHNGIMRMIMIRQPHDYHTSPKRIKAVNFFYFPTDYETYETCKKGLKVKTTENGELLIKYDPDSLDFLHDLHGPKAITRDNSTFTLPEFVEQRKTEPDTFKQTYGGIYTDVALSILHACNLTNGDTPNDVGTNHKYDFKKSGSLSFIREQMENCRFLDENGDVSYLFEPVNTSESDFDYSFKLKKLKQILTKHMDERVIVFFDYGVSSEDNMSEKVFNDLTSDETFKDRVITADEDGEIENEFNDNDNSILIVKNKGLTEGKNFQKCSIVVNFETVANPLDMQQRIGRVFRIGQENDVTVYSIANLFELESYLLFYYNLIGLFSSDNSGDAEILAGCNSKNMLVLRCSNDIDIRCSGEIHLVSKEMYEEEEDTRNCPNCHNPMYVMPSEVLQCSNNPTCKVRMRRSKKTDNMYSCPFGDRTGILCMDANRKERAVYCSKLCIMDHCLRFRNTNIDCVILKKYRELKHCSPELLDEKNCKEKCMNKDKKPQVFKECHKLGCAKGDGSDLASMENCVKCKEFSFPPIKRDSNKCRPFFVKFDEFWEGKCPACGDKLAPVNNDSFDAFIRTLFDFDLDGGKGFCDNFLEEIKKVCEIQSILRYDGYNH